MNISLTERELAVIVAALEAAKREEAKYNSETYREDVKELMALRNKLRDAA